MCTQSHPRKIIKGPVQGPSKTALHIVSCFSAFQKKLSTLCYHALPRTTWKKTLRGSCWETVPGSHPDISAYKRNIRYLKQKNRLVSSILTNLFLRGSDRIRTYDTPGMNRML